MTRAIVVGGGIVGIACARELASSGVQVTLVHEGPLAGGATAAGMGHLIALDDREPVARFTLRSLDHWSRMELPADCEALDCGCLWVAADEDEMSEAKAKHARYSARGVETRICSAADLRVLEPELAPDLAGGLLVPSDRVIYPPRAAAWMWEQAERRGAKRVGATVTGVRAGAVTLAGTGHLEADWVIVATGDRIARLIPSLPVVPRKGHLLITSRGPRFVRHQVVELGYARRAHGHSAESVACNVQPRATGQVLIGSSRQLGAHDPAVEPRILSKMIRAAARYFPRIGELDALRAWTGFRAATPDGAALIGILEPGLAVAGGHEGVGITQAPATGELVRDLILGRSPAVDASPFAPDRFGEAA